MTPMSDETDTARVEDPIYPRKFGWENDGVVIRESDMMVAREITAVGRIGYAGGIRRGEDFVERVEAVALGHAIAHLAQPAIDREAHRGEGACVTCGVHGCCDCVAEPKCASCADGILALASSNRSEGGGEPAGVRDAGREDVSTLDVFLAAYRGEHDDALVNRHPDDDLLTWGHLRRILAALTARPDGEMGAIPAGMKPWHGGDRPPADWDGGELLLRNGERDNGQAGNDWRHTDPAVEDSDTDIIAYTPSPTTNAGGERVIARLREALERIEYLSTNHGGWFETDPAVAYAELGNVASAALAAKGGEA